MVERSCYDLVFMDCPMPEMDGYEATRRLRQRYPSLPILAMTANAMAGDRSRCLEAGMKDYVPKPIDRNVLAEKAFSLARRPHPGCRSSRDGSAGGGSLDWATGALRRQARAARVV